MFMCSLVKRYDRIRVASPRFTWDSSWHIYLQDEYKSMAIDEFPQLEKPFLGDRIQMEKTWATEVTRRAFDSSFTFSRY